MLRRIMFSTLSLLVLLSLTLLSCSKNNPTDSDTGGTIGQTITVLPVTGPPLTVVTIEGLNTTGLNLDAAVAVVNGSITPLFSSDTTSVRVTIPIFIDSVTMTIDTSQSNLSVAIIDTLSGDTIAFGADIFAVTALTPSPGTTTQLVTDWQSIATSLQTISASIPTTPGLEEQMMTSMLSALDSLINGSDSLSLISLTSRLSSDNPQALELLDALMASSGVVEQSQKYTELFAALADSAAVLFPSPAFSSAVSVTRLTDTQLAYRMQLYVVVKEFGNTVISPTAQTYALVTGAVGIVGNFPLAAFISASLTIIDFVVNRLVVGMMPAKIDSMTLSFDSDTIIVPNKTSAIVMLYAKNDPPPISFQDLVGQLLNGLGLGGSISTRSGLNQIQSLKDAFEAVANFMLGAFQAGLTDYSNANRNLNLDVTVAQIPAMKWKAQIVDTKFIDLKSHTPNVIVPISGEVNWTPTGSAFGDGRVYGATIADNSATVIPTPIGFSYSAGAFGEEVGSLTAKTVVVQPGIVLETNMDPIITSSGANVLGIRAGIVDTAGVTQYKAGIKIDLFTIGGGADPSTGFTDATGQFTSIISLNPLTDTVTVHVTATGDLNVKAIDTLIASTQAAVVSSIAYLSDSDGTSAVWKMNPDGSNKTKLAGINGGFNRTNGNNLCWSPNNSYISMDITAFSNEVHAIRANGSLTNSVQIIRGSSFRLSSRNTSKQSWYPDTTFNELLFSGKHQTIIGTTGPYSAFIPGGYTKLFSSGYPRGMLRYSPDGSKFAFISGFSDSLFISTINLDGTGMVHITGPFTGGVRSIEWTADGTAFVYILEIGASSRSSKIMKTTMNGTTTTLATEATTSFNLTLLPTKNMLAYTVDSDNTGTAYNIKLVSLDGGSVTTIPNLSHRIFTLSASPDGNEIAFDDQPTITNSNVYKVNINTFVKTQLTFDGVSDTPGWSNSITAP